jgi:hypothetical protein
MAPLGARAGAIMRVEASFASQTVKLASRSYDVFKLIGELRII